MKFLKNLLNRTTEVIDATSGGIVSTAKSVDKYAQVVHIAATEAALDASTELAQKYGGQQQLLKRVEDHTLLMSKL